MSAKDFHTTHAGKARLCSYRGYERQEISGRAKNFWKTTQMSTTFLNNTSFCVCLFVGFWCCCCCYFTYNAQVRKQEAAVLLPAYSLSTLIYF